MDVHRDVRKPYHIPKEAPITCLAYPERDYSVKMHTDNQQSQWGMYTHVNHSCELTIRLHRAAIV
jgi:hypothetical protein